MKYKQNTFLMLLAILFHLACSQPKKPCEITPEQAPQVRGFKLLMTNTEIREKYPTFPTLTPSEFGRSVIVIANDDFSNDAKNRTTWFKFVSGKDFPKLEDLNRVYLEFLDDKLVLIRFYYTNELKWSSATEFSNKVKEDFQLQETWETQENLQILSCNGFMMSIGIGTDSSSFGGQTFPFIELEAYFLSHQHSIRQSAKEKNENANRQKQKDIFKP
jgi:hypothetical protein